MLQELLTHSEPGDDICVTTTYRLARCTISAMYEIEKLDKKDIKIIALDIGQLPTIGPCEIPTFFYLFAGKIELTIRKERVREGIRKAKLENKYKGRQTVITKEMVKKIKQYLKDNRTKQEMARMLTVSRSIVYKIIYSIENKKDEEDTQETQAKEVL